jgi:hypothetical protein
VEVGEGLLLRRARVPKDWKPEAHHRRLDGKPIELPGRPCWIGIELWQYDDVSQYEASVRSEDGTYLEHLGDFQSLDAAVAEVGNRARILPDEWEAIEIPLRHEDGIAGPPWEMTD